MKQSSGPPLFVGFKTREGLAMVNLAAVLGISVLTAGADGDLRVTVHGPGGPLEFAGDEAREFLGLVYRATGFIEVEISSGV